MTLPETMTLPEHVSDTLEYLQPHQVEEAASLLANAFLDDADPSPQYSWIVEDLLLPETPGTDKRRRQKEALAWLFRKNLEIQLERDAALGRNTFCRCALRRPPNEPPTMVCFFVLKDVEGNGNGDDDSGKISAWSMIRHGILRFPILFGFRVLYRLLLVKDYFDAAMAGHCATEDRPRRFLERMVVHPSVQGKGIGSYFLKRALESGSAPCLLATQEERNVAFYSRLGFEVVKRDEYGDSDQPAPGCTNWLMEREAS